MPFNGCTKKKIGEAGKVQICFKKKLNVFNSPPKPTYLYVSLGTECAALQQWFAIGHTAPSTASKENEKQYYKYFGSKYLIILCSNVSKIFFMCNAHHWQLPACNARIFIIPLIPPLRLVLQELEEFILIFTSEQSMVITR